MPGGRPVRRHYGVAIYATNAGITASSAVETTSLGCWRLPTLVALLRAFVLRNASKSGVAALLLRSRDPSEEIGRNYVRYNTDVWHHKRVRLAAGSDKRYIVPSPIFYCKVSCPLFAAFALLRLSRVQ